MKYRRYTGKPKNLRQGVCGFIAFLAFLGTIAAVGGLENGYMSFKMGMYMIMSGVIIFAVSLWGAGALSDGWSEDDTE